MQLYGYTSDMLKPKSGKRIIAVCDGCGYDRSVVKRDYHDLCQKCSHNTPEYLEKVSVNTIRQFEDPDARKRMSDLKKAYYADNPEVAKKMSETTIEYFSYQITRDKHSDIMKAYYAEHPISEGERLKRSVNMIKRYEDPSEREKSYAATKKHYAEMDDPGDEVCLHHYIYDHSDLSKYTMEITRSRHSKLHLNMWKSGIESPHINIVGCE